MANFEQIGKDEWEPSLISRNYRATSSKFRQKKFCLLANGKLKEWSYYPATGLRPLVSLRYSWEKSLLT